MVWSRCNTRPPRPRRANSRTRASPPCSRGSPPTSHGLCVVTTRYSIPDLRAYWQTTAPEEELPRLSKEAGVALLRTLGVNGHAEGVRDAGGGCERPRPHPETPRRLPARAHAGDIRRRDLVKFEKADAEEQGGHAFRAMATYEQWLLSGGEEGLPMDLPASRPRRGAALDRKAWLLAAEGGTGRRRSRRPRARLTDQFFAQSHANHAAACVRHCKAFPPTGQIVSRETFWSDTLAKSDKHAALLAGALATWPAARPTSSALQRLRPFGGRVTSVTTRSTFFVGIEGLRPRPAASSSPASPRVSKRFDHVETRFAVVFNRSAIPATPRTLKWIVCWN